MALDRQVNIRALVEDFPDLPKSATGRLYWNLIGYHRFQTVNQVLRLSQEELLGLYGMGTKTAALLFLLLERKGWLELSQAWPVEGASGKNILRKMEELRPLIPLET